MLQRWTGVDWPTFCLSYTVYSVSFCYTFPAGSWVHILKKQTKKSQFIDSNWTELRKDSLRSQELNHLQRAWKGRDTSHCTLQLKHGEPAVYPVPQHLYPMDLPTSACLTNTAVGGSSVPGLGWPKGWFVVVLPIIFCWFFVSILLIPEQLLEPFFFLLTVYIFFSSSSMLFTCPDQSHQRKLWDAQFMQFDFLRKDRLFLQGFKLC